MAEQTNLPRGPVSGRALARLLGLSSDNAVRTAVRSGRLRRCIMPGGYDPAVAIEEWQANTDPRQQRKVTSATDTAAASDAKRAKAKAAPAKGAKGRVRPAAPPADPSPPHEARGPDDLQARLAAHRARNLAKGAPRPNQDDEVGDDGESIADIRRSILLIDREEKRHDYHVKRKSYVPKDPALALAMTLGRRYRDSTLQFVDRYVASMAVELGTDEHELRMCLDRYMRTHFERTIGSIRDDTVVNGDMDDDEIEAEARRAPASEDA